jgi:hypothetical protein
MANSPTVCQGFVTAAIECTCCKYLEAYVLPYMDDILVSHPSESTLLLIVADLTKDFVHCLGKATKNASLSIFRASYPWMLDLFSKDKDQEG